MGPNLALGTSYSARVQAGNQTGRPQRLPLWSAEEFIEGGDRPIYSSQAPP